jgi:hypothetical protein
VNRFIKSLKTLVDMKIFRLEYSKWVHPSFCLP